MAQSRSSDDVPLTAGPGAWQRLDAAARATGLRAACLPARRTLIAAILAALFSAGIGLVLAGMKYLLH